MNLYSGVMFKGGDMTEGKGNCRHCGAGTTGHHYRPPRETADLAVYRRRGRGTEAWIEATGEFETIEHHTPGSDICCRCATGPVEFDRQGCYLAECVKEES